MTNLNCPDKHITIIKYLNYQKVNINNDLLQIISDIDSKLDKSEILNYDISTNQYTQIKKLINIFQNIPILCQNKKHLYYVFIMMNLPPFMVKNISRFYLSKLYQKYQITPKNNYFDFLKNSEYLTLLIENLEEMTQKDPEFILLYIDTLNLFFT